MSFLVYSELDAVLASAWAVASFLHPFSCPSMDELAPISSFADQDTKVGHLPPWEMAKGFALKVALEAISERTGVPAADLLGQRVDEFIAGSLTKRGGGSPKPRAVRKLFVLCANKSYYPGKPREKKGGRPPVIKDSAKQAIANCAMRMKENLEKITLPKLRARLPRATVNPDTQEPVSNWIIYKVFKSMCFDETEDDPWIYMPASTKEYLTDKMKERRVGCGEHIVDTFAANFWANCAAIDPCASLLAKSAERKELDKVRALGSRRWGSKKARHKGANAKAPAYVKSQAGGDVLKVHWTVIFAKDKVRIYVCDAARAANDPNLPKKLNNSEDLAKFVQHVLPAELQAMRDEFGWACVPRTIVHDKASYMVNARKERLNHIFAEGLRKGHFKSWLGDETSSTQWLSPRWGDVYLHETVISHIRRLLDTKFPYGQPRETVAHFRGRMRKIQDFMNSEDFAAKGGQGLAGLARDLPERCAAVVARGGGRLLK